VAIASIEVLKRYLDKDDSGEDALLENVLQGVADRMEREMDQPIFLQQVTDEVHQGAGYPTILINYGPVTEVNSLTLNGDTLTAADYEVRDGRSLVRVDANGSEFRWYGQIRISYKAGYATVPTSLQAAAIQQAAFEYRDTKSGGDRMGKASNSPEAGDSVSYTPMGWLPAVMDAMNHFKSIA
jgi:hypothetical protein